MRASDVPLVTLVFESGAADRMYDSLLLLGPVVVALIVGLGRTNSTEATALAYIGLFVTYVLYRGIA